MAKTAISIEMPKLNAIGETMENVLEKDGRGIESAGWKMVAKSGNVKAWAPRVK